MSFLRALLSDESGQPSSARVVQFAGFGAAVVFGAVGFFLPAGSQTYAVQIVASLLTYAGAKGIAAQAKAAKVLAAKASAKTTTKGPTDKEPVT